MKKIYLLLVMFGTMNTSFAQQKETAVTTIGSMTVKLLLDQSTSLVTITMTGPSTKWFSIALNTNSMSSNKDCITYGTSLLDQHMGSGHVAPITDTANNLTLVSNTVSGTTRTIVMTRPFITGDTSDYVFDFAITSLNIIWAVGPSTNISSQHSSFGSKTLTFNTLGIEDFASLDKVIVSPNPSNSVFTISGNNEIQISKIKIFDINAKLLKEIQPEITNENIAIDLVDLPKGLYFMEISSQEDKTVKKIMLN